MLPFSKPFLSIHDSLRLPQTAGKFQWAKGKWEVVSTSIVLLLQPIFLDIIYEMYYMH